MIEEEIKITGNTSDAQKSFEDLGKIIAEQKQITIEFEKELIDLEQQLVATGNADWNPKGDALKKKIVGIKEAIKDQRIALKDLNGQLILANHPSLIDVVVLIFVRAVDGVLLRIPSYVATGT